MAAYGVTSGLLCIAAAIATNAAPRENYFSPGLAPRSPQIMLYLSHSIGAGSGGRPTFGLKIDQLRQTSNLGDPDGGDAMQHRELVNWQMEAHSNLHIADLRMQLGHRVTYDLTNRSFGSPATRATMQLGTPTLRNAPIGSPMEQKSLWAQSSVAASSAAARDGGGAAREAAIGSTSLREIASAAVAALAPARFTSAQRQMAQRQGLAGPPRGIDAK
jgi:hypothetical protein